MGKSLSKTVALFMLLTVLVPATQARANSSEYQFMTGALTGEFTAAFTNDVFQSDPFQSWSITAPTGFGTMVWDSANPVQNVFENGVFGNPILSLFNGPFPGDFSIDLILQGSGDLADQVFGTYDFTVFNHTAQLEVSGTGEWARVPIPTTFWPFLASFMAMVLWWEWRKSVSL